MSWRKLLWAAPVALAVVLGFGMDRWLSAAGEIKQDLRPATSLPLTRVVLFNSGVGYFSRSGDVDGDARVDLTFPETDINDLLKSMVLQDFNGGRIAAVSYDSREPIARTLASFAINLNGNPSLANIAQQAQGRQVEITVSPTAANLPARLVGRVVGVESQKVPAGPNQTVDVAILNMWCADGMRAVKLPDILQLRFTDPALESELRRALDELARVRDSEKKAVSLHFAGDGRRKVQVGYVVEAPVWKTSYRLVLAEDAKPHLQGWAMVENPSDEDWTGVKMALVSGRPISFKMDLYNPLYVPRPTVEPELFASLRPPTYSGGFKQDGAMAQGGIGGFGGGGGGINGGFGGGGFAGMPAPGAAPMAPGLARAEGGKFDKAKDMADRRRHSEELGRELAGRMDLKAVGSSATSGTLGDFFQYAVDHTVTLGRQKSSLIPIITKDVEAARVSIYNPAVQPKHPLLGLRFKNTSGSHLAQGPITVFEGSTYAGDTRVLDVQPNEERLVSYAIDLGTEVIPQNGQSTGTLTSVKAVKGIVQTVTRFREEKTYKIANRSQTDRTLLIEHPNRTNQQFKVVEPAKPYEETAEVFRFSTPVKAGEEKTVKVIEERDSRSDIALTNSGDDQIRWVMSQNQSSPELKKKLTEALTLKAVWDTNRQTLGQVQADLSRLTADQDRIRKNLRETPKEAEVYGTYLKKLSDQEKEIDTLTARQKQLMTDEFAAKQRYEHYLANLSD